MVKYRMKNCNIVFVKRYKDVPEGLIVKLTIHYKVVRFTWSYINIR